MLFAGALAFKGTTLGHLPRTRGLVSTAQAIRSVALPNAAPTNLEEGLADDLAHVEAEGTFEWSKQWYALAVLDNLDKERPHKAKLLGKDVVIWYDGAVDGATRTSTRKQRGTKVRGEGHWRVFEDACPHRLAPLSEGRVEETGELLCAYHGWRFGSDGACTSIPQSPEHLEGTHCANSKASCNAYPTHVEDGLLFVWGESGPDAALKAAATGRQPNLVPELHDESLKDRVQLMNWNQRDLPYR